ncbi:MAG: nicotinamide-nucleotide amidase [Candidatus Poriferisodalaceae bacterium]|jgi:nicotinamide-nucleotide amidase
MASFETLVDEATVVANLLKERGESIAVCESSTGGLLAAALTAVPGASAYMIGGAVVYTMDARQALLSNGPRPPKGMRGATEEFAVWEATAIREVAGTTWGIGETGATGPTGNPYGDPAGHGWCAVSGPIEATRQILTGVSDRTGNMYAFVSSALATLGSAFT